MANDPIILIQIRKKIQVSQTQNVCRSYKHRRMALRGLFLEDLNSFIPGFHLSVGRFLNAPLICGMQIDIDSGLSIHVGGRSRLHCWIWTLKTSKIFLQSWVCEVLRWTCSHSTLVAEWGVSSDVSSGLKIRVWLGNPPRKVHNSDRALTAFVALIGEAVRPRNRGLLLLGKFLICQRKIFKSFEERM